MKNNQIKITPNWSNASNEPDQDTKSFKELANENFAQDIRLRKHFSYATFWLVVGWLIFVSIFLMFSNREAEVLIAVITGTTIKVLGLYYIVLRYLFALNSKTHSENDSDRS